METAVPADTEVGNAAMTTDEIAKIELLRHVCVLLFLEKVTG